MVKKKRSYGKAQRRKARLLKRLEEQSERYVSVVLTRFDDITREQLFDRKIRFGRPVVARRILFALLFHVVLQKRGRKLIAEHTGFSLPTVSDGIIAVGRALDRKAGSTLKIHAKGISRDLGLPKRKLTRAGAYASAYLKKKRSRR